MSRTLSYHKILYSLYKGRFEATCSPQFETKSVLGYGFQMLRNTNYQPLEFHVPQQTAVQIGALYPQWVSNILQNYRHRTKQFLACFSFVLVSRCFLRTEHKV